MSDYSFIYKCKIAWSLIITKIAFPHARLVRMPVYIRGKKGIAYGKGLTTGVGCRFDASTNKVSLLIGDNARFGDYVHINANERVYIGRNFLSASKVFISDASHGQYKGDNQDSPYTNPSERQVVISPVSIGDNVWVGENAVILPGSTIGDGCIIGANTLVNGGEYPAGCIIVGTPARIIKKYNNAIGIWEKYKGGDN